MKTGGAFFDVALENSNNAEILRRLPDTGLPDAWLVAGCLFQTVWNARDGAPLTGKIKDYDIFYFDDSDLSWEAEDRAIRKTAVIMQGIDVSIEVKNQARVHIWYREKFGAGYPQLSSSKDGIDRYLIEGTCVAIRADGDRYETYAPYGVGDISAGILKPNPQNFRPELYAAKAKSYQQRWPWLTILDEPAECTKAPVIALAAE